MSLYSITTSYIPAFTTGVVLPLDEKSNLPVSPSENSSLSPQKRTWSGRTSSDQPLRLFLEPEEDVDPESEKMRRVLEQAVKDHGLDPAKLPIDVALHTETPLTTFFTSSSNQGIRPSHEDSIVINPLENYDFFAIFDGHGAKCKSNEQPPGEIVAALAADCFKQDFFKTMKECKNNMPLAFNTWCDNTHKKIPEILGGTTAALGCLDKDRHRLCVGTLGDSEIVVIRENNNALFAIPLSPAMHWCTPAAEERAKNVMLPSIFEKWVKTTKPKKRRFPPSSIGKSISGSVLRINVAAALGDKLSVTHDGETAITHKPLCSSISIQEGDLIIVACDGVFDFMSLNELVEVIRPYWRNGKADIARFISTYAITKGRSKDNVSVIAVQINPEARQLSEILCPNSPEESLTQEGSQVVVSEG